MGNLPATLKNWIHSVLVLLLGLDRSRQSLVIVLRNPNSERLFSSLVQMAYPQPPVARSPLQERRGRTTKLGQILRCLDIRRPLIWHRLTNQWNLTITLEDGNLTLHRFVSCVLQRVVFPVGHAVRTRSSLPFILHTIV